MRLWAQASPLAMVRTLAMVWFSVLLFVIAPTVSADVESKLGRSAELATMTVATGNETGVYFPAGGAICRLVNEAWRNQGIRCFIESTDGSGANLEALDRSEVTFAILQSDWQYNAVHGMAGLKPHTSLRSVFGLHPEALTIVVRGDSRIHGLEDLKGKRVNIGSTGSGQRATVEFLLQHLGWSLDDFEEATELAAVDQPEALCRGEIDVMMYVVGHPNGAIKEVTTLCNARLVSLNGSAIDSLIAEFPYYRKAFVPARMYRNNDTATFTFGVGATLVTDVSTSEELVYRLVKAVFDNFDDFTSRHPALAHLNAASMASESLTAPMHPGALRYFREAGLIKK